MNKKTDKPTPDGYFGLLQNTKRATRDAGQQMRLARYREVHFEATRIEPKFQE
jgi:hypothetical protein